MYDADTQLVPTILEISGYLVDEFQTNSPVLSIDVRNKFHFSWTSYQLFKLLEKYVPFYILHFLIMTPYPIVILTKFCVHGMPDVRALVCLRVLPSQWIDRKVCFTRVKAAGSRS